MVPKKVAIVAEWLTWRGGGEAVVDALLELFPQARLFTTVYNESALPEYKKFRPVTSFLQKIPIARRRHQALPPLLLKAVASLDLSGYDLIISSSSSIGKGITKPKGSVHICYCHTPMRYVWHPEVDNRLIRLPFGRRFVNYLKKWDLKSNRGVDYFISNSGYTKRRIQKFYKRSAVVIYPPVDTDSSGGKYKKKDYYLCISRLIPYKRFDLAIAACDKLKRRLVVAGDGPEIGRLKKLAGETITFLGRVEDKDKPKLFAQARGLIFPAEEDFGIVPVEAMARGTGVIAYGAGGVLETVAEGKTGIFFKRQTASALAQAVIKYESLEFNRRDLVRRAGRFSKERFLEEFENFVQNI